MANNELPSIDMFYRSRFIENPTNVAYTGTAAKNGSALAPGLYLLVASTACYFLQGDSDVAATTSSIPLAADVVFGPIHVSGNADQYVSAIQKSAGGTISIISVK